MAGIGNTPVWRGLRGTPSATPSKPENNPEPEESHQTHKLLNFDNHVQVQGGVSLRSRFQRMCTKAQVDAASVQQVVNSVIVSLAAQPDSSVSEVATAATVNRTTCSPKASRETHRDSSIRRNLEGILCWEPEGLEMSGRKISRSAVDREFSLDA